jgi:hypothetical protein
MDVSSALCRIDGYKYRPYRRKGFARPDGSPNDIDREFITDFAAFDETDSWFFEGNLGKRTRAARLKATDPLSATKICSIPSTATSKAICRMLTTRKGFVEQFVEQHEDGFHVLGSMAMASRSISKDQKYQRS